MVQVNRVLKRLEPKVKSIWILYIENEEKIHLGKGSGFNIDFAEDNGGAFHDPAQAGHKQNGKGKEAKEVLFFHDSPYSTTTAVPLAGTISIPFPETLLQFMKNEKRRMLFTEAVFVEISPVLIPAVLL